MIKKLFQISTLIENYRRRNDSFVITGYFCVKYEIKNFLDESRRALEIVDKIKMEI